MKPFWNGFFNSKNKNRPSETVDETGQKVRILFKKVNNYFNNEQLLLKAGKVDALELMSSDKIRERLTALERILFDDPTIEVNSEKIKTKIERLEDRFAELLAERSIERDLEEQIAEKMEEKQREYLKEIKKEIVQGNAGTVDNAQTLKRLAQLEKMETRGLNRSTLELVRPRNLMRLWARTNH